MGSAETNTAKKFLADHAHGPIRLYRNNVGTAWAGKRVGTVHPGKPDQAVIVRPGSFVEFGLKKGSGDWVGWESVVITPDMVGRRFARFLSVEVKSIIYPDRSKEQIEWSELVLQAGGRSLLVREVQEEPGYTVEELGRDPGALFAPEGVDEEAASGRRN